MSNSGTCGVGIGGVGWDGGWGGLRRAKCLKESRKLNWKFQRGWDDLNQKIFCWRGKGWIPVISLSEKKKLVPV